MSDKSKIEWTDATWNPTRGCSKVSAGCANCYAEKVAARFSGEGLPYEGTIDPKTRKWNGRLMMSGDKLTEPLRWRQKKLVFVNSMSDLFHEGVTDAYIDKVFAVMSLCPKHEFQILTKRPERMHTYLKDLADPGVGGAMNRWYRAASLFMPIDDFPEFSDHGYLDWDWTMDVPAPLPNVWLGVSVEDQKTADERIPWLLKTPAAVRFVSYEPALGPVDFECVTAGADTSGIGISYRHWDALTGENWNDAQDLIRPNGTGPVNWVIVGGESGPNARPMHPDWARSARDQCQAAGVSFFFKQWGEWLPDGEYAKLDFYQQWRELNPDGCITEGPGFTHIHTWNDHVPRCSFKVGKKTAGRLLDGREWNEMPSGAGATA